MDLTDNDAMDSSNSPIGFDGDERDIGLNRVPQTRTDPAGTAATSMGAAVGASSGAGTAATSMGAGVGASSGAGAAATSSRRPPTCAAAKKSRRTSAGAKNMSTSTTSAPKPSTPEATSSGVPLVNSLGFTTTGSTGQQESQGQSSLYELMKEYQGEEDEDNTESSAPPLNNSGFLSTISARVATRRPSVIRAKCELDRYLEDELIPIETENFQILDWWKVAGTRYPTLRKIARDIFAIPVSTVASESAFSTSGRVLSEHRSRLTPEILEALMCSQDWLRNKFKDVENDNKPETFWSCLQEIQEGVEGLTLC